LTVLEILQESTKYLTGKNVESPRLQSELLLSHVLGIPRLQLYLQFDRPMEEAHLSRLRPLLRSRAQHIPLQHILGTANFCGLEIECSPAALIPRPETELLVERVVEELKNIAEPLVYDVGTGTGAIALAIAQKLPAARIIAIDISPEALNLAHKNHLRYPAAKITWQTGDLLTGIKEGGDLIVANLPYLFTTDMETLPDEVKHDPPLALDGGTDGLDLIRSLIPQAVPLCHTLALEIDPRQADILPPLLKHHGFAEVKTLSDLQKRPRHVLARSSA